MAQAYTAKEIYVLEGLEPVRKRPAMYIGSTGPEGVFHLLKEVVGNSIDEAMMGFCNQIKVTLISSTKVSIEDNGRGIPVDIHPQTKKSGLETVITYLHSGAKFGGKVYRSTGGLHGVGISVVCALSKWMKAEVKRDGFHFAQEYSRGKAITKLKKIGKANSTGTIITFEPDPQIFPKIEFSPKEIKRYLREQALLTPGVKIIFENKKDGESFCFYFEGGIKTFLEYLLEGEKRIQERTFYLKKGEKDIFVEIALCYTQSVEPEEVSFVNNVETTHGGTHLAGFRAGLTKAILNWGKSQGLIDEKTTLEGQDVREGICAIVSVKVPDPQFEGQTKQKLGNPEVKPIVEKIFFEEFLQFLNQNPKDGKNIVSRAILAAEARKAAKVAREAVLKKGILEGTLLPGKLTDCISDDPSESELFIVEGESAGGSARQARDRKFQAILPLKGKILNVEKAHLNKILKSKEIKSLILALGTAIEEDFDIEKLRYHKIILMSDSDVDGAHIRTLLLTLFFRYFRPVIEKGYLYIAKPPLYKIQTKKETIYAYTEEEKEKILKKIKDKNLIIQRYKGLGEMNPEELWETTMNPEKRILKEVTIEDAKEADKLFDILMGEEVLPRREFIQAYAREVKNLDI